MIRKQRSNSILALISLVVAFTFLQSPAVVQADTKAWSQSSPYDGYTAPNVNPYYDLDFLSAAEWNGDISASTGKIYFWLYFTNPVSKNMFNDNQGSWASLYIDFNNDGVDEVSVEIDGITLRESSYSTSVWLKSDNSGAGNGKCGVVAYTSLETSAKWVGIAFDKRCVGLPTSFWVKGQAVYNADNGGPSDLISPWYLTIPGTATTVPPTIPATSPPTTAVVVPNAPSSISIIKTSESSLKVSWLDNSLNEAGFLIQRNDLPVTAGTTAALWPYKSAANINSWDATGLATGKQYCFAVASYNSAGVASSFSEFGCLNLAMAVTLTTVAVTAAPNASLTCDGVRISKSKKSVSLQVAAGVGNAGKKLFFEIYSAGRWINAGFARVDAGGTATVKGNTAVLRTKGPLPIRASQGSRFLCEGTLSG